MSKSLFITFEGIDGCGKTTQIRLLESYLKNELDKNVISLREPGGTVLGEKIRETLLSSAFSSIEPFSDKSELLLFCAARAQLVENIIKPALAQFNAIVLCDRFIDSTIAYQGFGRKIGTKTLLPLLDFVIGDTVPNKTFYIEVPRETAEARKYTRKDNDRMEKNKAEFYNSVIEGYNFCKSEFPERVVAIDGTRHISEVFEDIKKQVIELL